MTDATVVDAEFLSRVEQGLGEALDRITAQEELLALELPTPQNGSAAWQEIMERLNTRLAGWQTRIGALAGEVGEIGADLTGHHDALQSWVDALDAARNRCRPIADGRPVSGDEPTAGERH